MLEDQKRFIDSLLFAEPFLLDLPRKEKSKQIELF